MPSGLNPKPGPLDSDFRKPTEYLGRSGASTPQSEVLGEIGMRKTIVFASVLLLLMFIGSHVSARMMRPAKKFETSVAGNITVEQVDGKTVYYLVDGENNRIYTLGDRAGNIDQEFVDVLETASEQGVPLRIRGELSIWKDRVLSLKIIEVRYDDK